MFGQDMNMLQLIHKLFIICFQYAFLLTQYYKEIKNNGEQVSNIKPFFDL